MKTYFICENDYFVNPRTNVKHDFTEQFRFFSKEAAEQRLAIYQMYYAEHPTYPGKENKRWLEEREENLTLFKENIYLPETIQVDGVEKRLIVDKQNHGLDYPRVKTEDGFDITLALCLDIIHMERFSEFFRRKDDRWYGLHTHLINECVLTDIYVQPNGLYRLRYLFTTSAYLDQRQVYGEVCELKENSLKPIGDTFIGINVYF